MLALRKSAFGLRIRIWRSAFAANVSCRSIEEASPFGMPTGCDRSSESTRSLSPTISHSSATLRTAIRASRASARRERPLCLPGMVLSNVSLAEVLGEHRVAALLFKDLATLRTDAKLFANIDELKWRGPTADFPTVCERLGASDLLARATRAAASLTRGRIRRRAEYLCVARPFFSVARPARRLPTSAQIRALRLENNRAFLERDVAALRKPWKANIRLIESDGTEWSGADALARSYAGVEFRDPRFVEYVRIPTSITIAANGLHAAESGNWTLINKAPERVRSGTYLASWEKIAGTWKIVYEAYVALNDAPQSVADALHPLATLHLGGTPDWLAVTPDSVWVANDELTSVQRVDVATNALVARIKLPDEPCSGLAFGFGSLWVPLCGDASFARARRPVAQCRNRASSHRTGVVGGRDNGERRQRLADRQGRNAGPDRSNDESHPPNHRYCRGLV